MGNIAFLLNYMVNMGMILLFSTVNRIIYNSLRGNNAI